MYWSMVINFLTVLITCVTCKTAPTFVEIPAYSTLFKTDQYLFVGINHCTLYTQRAVPARTCPYYAVYQSRWALVIDKTSLQKETPRNTLIEQGVYMMGDMRKVWSCNTQ